MTVFLRRFATSARVLLAGVAALLLLATPAGAQGPPLQGSGTGTVESLVITSSREAGENVIQERTLTGTVTGTLEGTFVERVRGVIHGDRLVTFQGTLTFTGTLQDCGEGTITLGVSGRGVPGVPVTEAKLRVIDQASNTIDVTGVGTVDQVGPNMEYELQYVCR